MGRDNYERVHYLKVAFHQPITTNSSVSSCSGGGLPGLWVELLFVAI
jgi:hypothetical protein